MNLNEYTKGWLVGNFSPALFQSNDVEVGVKKYKSGDKEARHVHNFIDEYTIILTGIVKMNGKTYFENDIIYIPKTVSTDFECLEDSITLVVKTPSIPSDKEFV